MSGLQTITIRLRRGRAAKAQIERVDGLVRLHAVLPHEGELPDCSDLAGSLHLDAAGVRRAVLARLRSPRRDTLDRVLLTPAAVRAWERHAKAAAALLPPLTPEQVAALPDEQAQAQEDGRLLVWVDTPHGPVSMLVEPGDWAWAPGRKS